MFYSLQCFCCYITQTLSLLPVGVSRPALTLDLIRLLKSLNTSHFAAFSHLHKGLRHTHTHTHTDAVCWGRLWLFSWQRLSVQRLVHSQISGWLQGGSFNCSDPVPADRRVDGTASAEQQSVMLPSDLRPSLVVCSRSETQSEVYSLLCCCPWTDLSTVTQKNTKY